MDSDLLLSLGATYAAFVILVVFAARWFSQFYVWKKKAPEEGRKVFYAVAIPAILNFTICFAVLLYFISGE